MIKGIFSKIFAKGLTMKSIKNSPTAVPGMVSPEG